jgi:hypothetical protein
LSILVSEARLVTSLVPRIHYIFSNAAYHDLGFGLKDKAEVDARGYVYVLS